jgi:hypothetical protein
MDSLVYDISVKGGRGIRSNPISLPEIKLKVKHFWRRGCKTSEARKSKRKSDSRSGQSIPWTPYFVMANSASFTEHSCRRRVPEALQLAPYYRYGIISSSDVNGQNYVTINGKL